MIKEIDIGGIYLSPVLGMAVLAFVVTWIVATILNRLGFYRLVWHHTLFDAALFMLVFGAATVLVFGLP
jgi:hypothetical protein